MVEGAVAAVGERRGGGGGGEEAGTGSVDVTLV